MSVENKPAGETGGNGEALSQNTAPQAAPPAAPVSVSMTSEQLKARLEEERSKGAKAILKKFNFEKEEDLAAAFKTLEDLKTEKLSESEKAAKRLKELEPYESKFKTLESEYASMVEEQFSALPENVQKAIDDVAGGKPAERARVMKAFRANGLIAAQPPGIASPKTTAPTQQAPTPAPTKSKFDEWSELKATNPILASFFYKTHTTDIEASRPSG